LRRLGCALALSAIALAAPAFAKGKAAPAADPNAAVVEDLANQAAQKYAEGDFAQAVALSKKAYDIEPLAALLFNIATIYDKKMSERDLAMEYYRRFIAAKDADPARLEKATRRLEALKAQAPDNNNGNNNPPPATTVVITPPPVIVAPQKDDEEEKRLQRRSLMRISGIVAIGLGVVAIGIGSAFGVLAMNRNNDAGAFCNGPSCSDPKALTLTNDALTFANVSTAMFVVGGVAAVAGVLLFVLAPPGKKSVALAPQLGPGQGGLAFVGRF
jgi:tetratricopeptide (TPR) repeat protein